MPIHDTDKVDRPDRSRDDNYCLDFPSQDMSEMSFDFKNLTDFRNNLTNEKGTNVPAEHASDEFNANSTEPKIANPLSRPLKTDSAAKNLGGRPRTSGLPEGDKGRQIGTVIASEEFSELCGLAANAGKSNSAYLRRIVRNHLKNSR